ncbi:MAG TPA: hypothetical protein VFX85_12715 [Solirubrobacterales bacterium]|nr:hypothetical protein [Solirubrobacterales bacterium]
MIVAEAGDPNVPPERRIATSADFDRSWADRLKVAVEVDDEEPLGDLLRRAGAQLDQMGPYKDAEPEAYVEEAYLPVYLGVHREGRRLQLWSDLPLVDPDGHIRWVYNWGREPYRELLRATEAGAIKGDPARLYFVRMGGMGDGVLADFPRFIETLPLLWEVIEHVATAYGAYEAAQRLLRAVGVGRKAAEVANEKSKQWEANAGLPYKLTSLLWREEGWDAAELGRLLDVTAADAEALLTAFGCSEESDGRWQSRADELANLMAGNAEYVIHSHHTDKAAMREVLRQRIESFLTTGKAPDLPWEKLSRLPMDPSWSANHWQGEHSPRLRDRMWRRATAWRWRLRLFIDRWRRR